MQADCEQRIADAKSLGEERIAAELRQLLGEIREMMAKQRFISGGTVN